MNDVPLVGPSNVYSRLVTVRPTTWMGCSFARQGCMSHSDKASIPWPVATPPKSTSLRHLQLVLVLVLWGVSLSTQTSTILNYSVSPQATLANPLFLVKARMQAYSPTLPVGTQRHYTSLFHALRSIYYQDGGLRALFRGVPTAVVRTSMGTSFQMPSYFWMKRQLHSRGLEGFGVVIASSVFAGAVVVSPICQLAFITV